jgi:hypothetical protein
MKLRVTERTNCQHDASGSVGDRGDGIYGHLIVKLCSTWLKDMWRDRPLFHTLQYQRSAFTQKSAKLPSDCK